jgi:pyrroloquinoline quinone (PQQ) biosynthesis protein C
MESWSIDRYLRPRLAIAGARFEARTNTIEIVAPQGSVIIEGSESQMDLAALAQTLNDLRNPRSQNWQIAKSADKDGLAHVVLTRLDELSLVEDEDIEGEPPIAVVLSWVESIAGAVLQELSNSEQVILRRIVPGLMSEARQFAGGNTASTSTEHVKPASFCLEVIHRQFMYSSANSPATLAACILVLDCLRDGWKTHAEEVTNILGSNLWTANLKDLAASLNSLGCLLIKSVVDDQHPLAHLRDNFKPVPCTGSTLAIHAERASEDVLAAAGESRLLRAIQDISVTPSLVAGCFLEEYHVTCRFVEIIASALAKRHAETLRRLLFRYYSEEVGHERYELATCKSLGIGDAEIAEALPMPLHLAFVDAFTAMATRNPISYFASIFITEGRYGACSPLNEYIDKSFAGSSAFHQTFRRHEKLNDELSHASLSRMLLKEVAHVTAEQYDAAIRDVILLTQLNCCAWDDLTEHYSTPNPIPYSGLYGMPPLSSTSH